MAHQAGADNTIAISGTALTPPQISLIKRLTNKIILALDADSAGVQATLRSAKLALAQDIQVRVATIPDGKDPADYIVAHPGKWDEVLASAEPVVPYLLRLYVKLGLHGEPLRERINKEVFPLVAAVPSRIAQAHLVLEIARLLGVREDVVWDDLKRSVREAEQEPVYEDERSEVVSERPAVRNVSPRIRAEEELLGLLLWQEIHPEAKLSHSSVRESRERLFRELEVEPLTPGEDDASRLLIMAESRYTPEAKLEEIAEELLDRIERELLKERQEYLLREIARAESGREDTSLYMSQYRSLTPRIIAVEDRMRNRAHLY
jgi:DNA primase